MDEKNLELLDQLNRFTRRKHSLDEVYIFDLILCDNEIDRDGDCFSDQALAEMQKRFVGVTGIFDHDARSGNQTARIFRTELRTDPGHITQTGAPYRCLTANAYMIRTDKNADLIREIDGGIKKEVSVSCAVGKRICSVCGTNLLRKPCSHIKGHFYGGQRCYTTLDEINDVYEWSFVAVPAQPHAGVTKKLGGAPCNAELELLRAAYADACKTLDRLNDLLRRDVVRLCYRYGDNACAKALADSVLHLDTDALLALRKSLTSGDAPVQSKPQLSDPAVQNDQALHAFSIGGRTGGADHA
jgi:hypothetical protein